MTQGKKAAPSGPRRGAPPPKRPKSERRADVEGALAEYRRKRDFARTPEPKGRAAGQGGSSFVIQKHAARRLHYDFRLEMEGVLKSWAVTKEPPKSVGEKRLAIRTEDHPLEYGAFEGVIPEGYGKGSVEIWDRGIWRANGDAAQGLARGQLDFNLAGERLKGRFSLVRLKEPEGAKEAWLLIRRRDANDRAPAPVGKSAIGLDFVPFQLATPAVAPPRGEDWIHEIKYDGYRIAALKQGARSRLYSRNRIDWTEREPRIAAAVAALPCDDAILDGELVAFDEAGVSRFEALRNRRDDVAIAAVWFDLLRLDGEDLRGAPLLDRKATLQGLLGGAPALLRYSDHIVGSGAAAFENACRLGLEGIISKRASSAYRSGRTDCWRKVKCLGRDDFVVIGWRKSDTRGRPFTSLLLAEQDGDAYVYRGRVGGGFDDAALQHLTAQLKDHETPSPRAAVPREAKAGVVWTEPRVVVAIRHSGLTESGALRHPVFLDVREDMGRGAKPSIGASSRPRRLTHPDRLVFPDAAISKRALFDYYDLVGGSAAFAWYRNRPASLLRCPGGVGEKCFFQKHATAAVPDAVDLVAVTESDGGREDYFALKKPEALAAAAQGGAVEIHIWGSRIDRIEHPDRLVFDLDPDEALPFGAVKEAAFALRAALLELKLQSFALATGGKGVHVVCPIARTRPWPEVKAFARGFAETIADGAPGAFVAAASKARRKGRIFIDWMRNQRGATAIAPYAVRAKPMASVAAPVTWPELKKLDSPAAFDIRASARRLARGGDPWADYFDVRQSIRKSDFDRLATRS